MLRKKRRGSFFTHVYDRNRTEALLVNVHLGDLGATARTMTASGAREWRHTAMIAYDDVDNDRGSAKEGGGGEGGRSPSRQARNRRRAVSLPGQFLLVRRVVDFFRILEFAIPNLYEPGNAGRRSATPAGHMTVTHLAVPVCIARLYGSRSGDRVKWFDEIMTPCINQS